MKRISLVLVAALAAGVILGSARAARAADEPANVAGNWAMTVESERGSFTQTLKIEQNGGTIKGTLSGRRGESPIEGIVNGNDIKFTIKRDTPNGTVTVKYSGTVDGDSMKGTLHSERFDANWTAKRSKDAAQQ